MLLRIALTKTYRYIIYTSIAIMCTYTVGIFLIGILRCRPLSLVWDVTWTPSSGKGTCLDQQLIVNLGYSFSAMSIFFDWLFALLPVPILWGLHIKLHIKISLFLVLGLGVL
jgi:hypothetical protein